MSNDTDLTHQPDTVQQSPPLVKNKSNSIWKVIKRKLFRSFIALFFILNLMFLIFISPMILEAGRYGDGVAFVGIAIMSGILAIIDFIPVLLYIVTQHPQGIAKVISYTGLITIIFVLMYAAPITFLFFYELLLKFF